MGRNKLHIDWQTVAELIQAGANGAQVCSMIGVSYETITRRCLDENNIDFGEFMATKKEKGNATLLMKQYELAIDGDRAMLIWLGKQRLDQADKKEIKQDVTTGGDKLNGISPIQWIDEQSEGDKDK